MAPDPAAPAAAADGPPGPRSRKGERTRARMLEAAKAVFEEAGFLDARTTDIAARAGVSHGAFYHYFESKEEIFREVAEIQQDRLSEQTVVASGLLDSTSGASMWDRLRASNQLYLEGYRDEAGIIGVIEQVSRYDAEVGAARFERQTRYVARTAEAIRHLQAHRLADPHLDPDIVANALTAMVSRFAEMWFVDGRLGCDFDEGVDQLTKLCMNALGLVDKKDRRRRMGDL